MIRKNGDSYIAVTGCYAGYDRSSIENIDGVRAVFDNSKKDEFFAWMESLPKGDLKNGGSSMVSSKRTRAFLKIQDGCNHRCSYCVVPLMRGPSRSKELKEVVQQAHRLVLAGHREIVLTGVNLGSFGKDLTRKSDLVEAIDVLEKIGDLDRIRLSSIEASEISERLLDKMAHSNKLCPHLHIPFQSGDDDVLRAMNKKMKVGDYMRIVEEAKKNIRDLAITCDFIIGYPSEDESSFKNTVKFLEFTKPLKTHIFAYSPRRGVASASMPNQASSATVKSRFHQFKDVAENCSREYRKRYLGRELEVLFEVKKSGFWAGYSQNYIKVLTQSPKHLANLLINVELDDLNSENCIGKIV